MGRVGKLGWRSLRLLPWRNGTKWTERGSLGGVNGRFGYGGFRAEKMVPPRAHRRGELGGGGGAKRDGGGEEISAGEAHGEQ